MATRSRITPLLCLAFLLAPLPSEGQGTDQAEQAQAPATEPKPGLESITVTARKVEQDLQTTAEAVTVFTGQDLEDGGIDEVKNIGRITPNVRFDNVPGTGTTATVGIRGILQTDLLITGDPSVGIYVDGIYNARLVGGNFSFFDIERVEILKGPQGTLYGKNTPAGAINIWSRRPSPKLGGFLRATYGSHKRTDAEGAISFPLLGEELSARIAFLSRNDRGFIHHHSAPPFGTFAGTDNVSGRVGDQNSKGVRLSLLWDASDRVEMWGQAYRYRERRKGGFPHVVSYVNPSLITSPVISPAAFDTDAWAHYTGLSDRDDIYTNQLGRQDLDTFGGSFTASYDFGGAELKYLGGHRAYVFRTATDTDGSPLPLLDGGRSNDPTDEKSRQSSHELTLTGSALDDTVTYATGVYYFDERSSNQSASYFDYADFGGGPFSFVSRADLVSRIETYAVYGQGTYHLTDRLGLTLGLRHTEERREVTSQSTSLPRTRVSGRWDSLTWLAGLEFQATDHLFAYAKVGTGYRSGGFPGRASSVDALRFPYDEEFVTAYEVGLKSDWLDNRLRANLAFFYQKYKDRQVGQLISLPSGIASVVLNRGSADIPGGELEVWAQATPSLRLGGSIGWNWFRQEGGRESANNPKFTYYVFGDYLFPPFDFGQLRGRLEMQYQSRLLAPGPETPGPDLWVPPFGVMNGRLGLELPHLNTEAALIVTNILDRDYYTIGVDFIPSGFGYQTRYYAPGRRFAFELTYRFGAEAR